MTLILQDRIAFILTSQRGQPPDLIAKIILDRLSEEQEYDQIVREALNANIKFYQKVKSLWPTFNRGEIETLNILLAKDYVSYEALFLLTRSKGGDNILRVWVSRIRKRTKAEITNHYGKGYSMKPEDRQRLKSLLEIK